MAAQLVPENEHMAPSPELSSWVTELEELLLNSDDYSTEPAPPPSQDDFFADLHLPTNEDEFSQLLLDFPVGDEFDDILDFDVDNLLPHPQFGDLNDEGSTPESQFDFPVGDGFDKILDFDVENLLPHPQFGDLNDGGSTPESQFQPQVRVFNDGHSTSDSHVRVLSGENSKRSADADADAHAHARDADDPVTKKRKRQMRNRDAAVKSRERKKMHVKDLEVKSRYLEGECIRLQRLLQWVAAENHALHLQLHNNNKAFGAAGTKQESAVLFLETLLLVSLLWFLGIMGLFPHLEMRPQLKENILENVDSNNQEVVDLGRAKSKSIGLGTLRLFFKSKRCKASRSKIKVVTCFGAVVA